MLEEMAVIAGSAQQTPRVYDSRLSTLRSNLAAEDGPLRRQLQSGMTVLIDQAIWPAHDTLWAHIVSDASLDELHAFARAVGLPRRSFDHDHYDVPARMWAELVAQGAQPVGVREFVERLQASGLRVPQRDRRTSR